MHETNSTVYSHCYMTLLFLKNVSSDQKNHSKSGMIESKYSILVLSASNIARLSYVMLHFRDWKKQKINGIPWTPSLLHFSSYLSLTSTHIAAGLEMEVKRKT